ncbi:hypothetical protein Cs7R123_49390 [Catellatospora sp. TT07R-123]|uniref:hypothetical protein n=1 Tax=Catellatospora sp. TT07R-123 TaxID=2733863 RepID=UPI001B22CA6F|nr:hypothetical protein [Catellatospora sp. TT07R-123]GHJ47597.1 hypothetical protein Cs7R123_49390 [Catellatospora sp. TT07R-123]
MRWTSGSDGGGLADLSSAGVAAPTGLVVVIGAAATGVSTVLHRLAGQASRDGRVTLTASAARWRPGERTFPDWLTDAAIAAEADLALPVVDRWLRAERVVADAATVALVDDADTIPAAWSAAAWAGLTAYAAAHLVVVGCREQAYARLEAAGVIGADVRVIRLHRTRLADAAARDGWDPRRVAGPYTPPDAMPLLRRAPAPAAVPDADTIAVTTYLFGGLATPPAAGPAAPAGGWTRAQQLRWLGFLARHLDRRRTGEIRFWHLIAEVPAVLGAVVYALLAALVFELTSWPGILAAERLSPGVTADLTALMTRYLHEHGASYITVSDPSRAHGHLWWLGVLTVLAAMTGASITGSLATRPKLPAAARTRLSVSRVGAVIGLRRGLRYGPAFLLLMAVMRYLNWPAAAWDPATEWLRQRRWFPLGGWQELAFYAGVGYAVFIAITVFRESVVDRPAPAVEVRTDDLAATLSTVTRRSVRLAAGFGLGPLLLCLLIGVLGTAFPENMPHRPSLAAVAVEGVMAFAGFGLITFLGSAWGRFHFARIYLAARGHLPAALPRFLIRMQGQGILACSGAVLRFTNPAVRRYLSRDGATSE